MIDSTAGTTRNAATSSVKTSWPAKIRRARMTSAGRRDRAARERAGKRQDKPGDDAEPDRQRGGGCEIRSQSELGIDQHRQHIDICCERKRGAERPHRGRKSNCAGGNEGRRE